MQNGWCKMASAKQGSTACVTKLQAHRRTVWAGEAWGMPIARCAQEEQLELLVISAHEHSFVTAKRQFIIAPSPPAEAADAINCRNCQVCPNNMLTAAAVDVHQPKGH